MATQFSDKGKEPGSAPISDRYFAEVLAEREIEYLRVCYYPSYTFGPVILYIE